MNFWRKTSFDKQEEAARREYELSNPEMTILELGIRRRIDSKQEECQQHILEEIRKTGKAPPEYCYFVIADASKDPGGHVETIIESVAKEDARVQLVKLECTGLNIPGVGYAKDVCNRIGWRIVIDVNKRNKN